MLYEVITDVGVLGVFKYYNFFVDGFIDMVALFGYNLPLSATKIILPMGISFSPAADSTPATRTVRRIS